MRKALSKVRGLVPAPLQRLGEKLLDFVPYRLRYGAVYRDTLELLRDSESWSADRLREYQLARLRSLVRHAYENVPYYKSSFDAAGVLPEDLHSLDDIRKFPTVEKNDLRHQAENFRARDFPDSAFQYHTTGGSTGKPVALYWQADRTVPMEKAFMKRQFDWIGVDIERDRIVNVRGIPPRKGRLFDKVGRNQLRLSSYRMTPEIMDKYVSLINQFRPVVLQAYPSSAVILARHIIENDISLPEFKAVLVGSEQFFSWQRELIERAFNCRAYSWYGQSEYVALAGECEESNEYHFYAEYGLAEILDKTGVPVEPGDTGEIVATGFLNNAFPLIRYRTEDLATLSRRSSCPCGRAYLRAESIQGRIQEMIVGKEGNLVSMTAINMHDNAFDSVHEFQFFQREPGKISMRIVPKEWYDEEQRKGILAALKAKVGDQFEISIEIVDRIERTPRGKSRFLDQKLPVAQEWSAD